VLLAATLAGCASAPPPRGGDETARFEAIRARFETGDYAQVILELQAFLGDHPGSRYADEGIFILGRANYEDGNFPEAEDRFRRILTDYPESPFAADASYHLGLALLSQSRSPQLDQTETISALTQFRSFIVRYPTSPLVGRAEGHIADIRAKLAEKEYLTGELYYRLGAQSAARLYLKDKVLVEYADTPVAAKAMLKLAESYRRTGDWAQVAEWAARLGREHADRPEAASAAGLLDEALRHGAEAPAEASAPAVPSSPGN
jgi:outer membrane protein assembly factor BamD